MSKRRWPKDPLNLVQIKNPFGFLQTKPQADAWWVALISFFKKFFFLEHPSVQNDAGVRGIWVQSGEVWRWLPNWREAQGLWLIRSTKCWHSQSASCRGEESHPSIKLLHFSLLHTSTKLLAAEVMIHPCLSKIVKLSTSSGEDQGLRRQGQPGCGWEVARNQINSNDIKITWFWARFTWIMTGLVWAKRRLDCQRLCCWRGGRVGVWSRLPGKILNQPNEQRKNKIKIWKTTNERVGGWKGSPDRN